MDLILEQIKEKVRKLNELDSAVDAAYHKYIHPIYDKTRVLNEEIEELRTEYVSSIDMSGFTLVLGVNKKGQLYYTFGDTEEERKYIDLLQEPKLNITANHYGIGDDILKAIVNDWDVHFTSSNILLAQERHGFKIDTRHVEKMMKEKVEELEILTKLMEDFG